MANGELTPRRPEIAFQISEANPQAGLPAGGDKDYVLRKKTAEDFDVEWDASAVAPNSLEPEQLKADEDGDKASFRDRISAVSKADLENEKAARATQEDAIRDELRSETAARTSGDASLGTRIDSVSQYPQADRDKLAAIGVRDITGLTISGRNITFSWTDSAGAEQNRQIQIPAVQAAVSASLSLTPVATQAELDGLSTTGIALAVVTTAFGSYAAQDLLVYDHGDSAWEKAGTFGASLADDSIEASKIKAGTDNEKLSWRTKIAAAAQSALAALTSRVGVAENKLNTVASGAEVNVNADWNASTGDAQILNKPSIPGNTEIDARIQLPARTSNASRWPKSKVPSDTVYTGTQRFSSTDKTKLDGIENNATADQSATEIRDSLQTLSGNARLAATAIRDLPQGMAGLNQAAVDARIAALRPNAFTNADETKLDGIAAGAEVNVNANWNASSGDAQILNKPTIPGNTQIDARIATEARTGNTSRWAKAKLPADVIYTATQRFTTALATTLEDMRLKLSGIQGGAEQNVQSDWNESTTNSDAFIRNKPTIPGNTQIDARIATQARAGNTSRWASSKLPTDVVYTNTQRFTTALLTKLNALPSAADLEFNNHAIGTAGALNALSRTTSSLDFVTVTAAISSGITANTVVDGSGTALTSLAAGDLLILDHANNRWVRVVNLPTTTVVSQATVRNFIDGDFVEGLLAGLTGADRLSYDSLKDTPTIPTLPAAATQAEAEAGTEVGTRLFSPLRVSQAIEEKVPIPFASIPSTTSTLSVANTTSMAIASNALTNLGISIPSSRSYVASYLSLIEPPQTIRIGPNQSPAAEGYPPLSFGTIFLKGKFTISTRSSTSIEFDGGGTEKSWEAAIPTARIENLPAYNMANLDTYYIHQITAVLLGSTQAVVKQGSTTIGNLYLILGHSGGTNKTVGYSLMYDSQNWGATPSTAQSFTISLSMEGRFHIQDSSIGWDGLRELPEGVTGRLANNRGKYIKVTDRTNTRIGLEYVDAATGGFIDHSDTPSTFTGQGGRFVAVNAGGTALEFVANPGGPTSGLTQSQVDARVIAGTLAQARAGNTTRWPVTKVPTLSTLGGLTQGQVDTRAATAIQNSVETAARQGTIATFAKTRLPSDVVYTGTQRFTDALNSKLGGIAAGAEVNVQPNWNENSPNSDALIRHKPANVDQAEAEAGTSQFFRIWSSQRVRQNVDARVAPTARTGNTDRWAKTKLPEDTVYGSSPVIDTQTGGFGVTAASTLTAVKGSVRTFASDEISLVGNVLAGVIDCSMTINISSRGRATTGFTSAGLNTRNIAFLANAGDLQQTALGSTTPNGTLVFSQPIFVDSLRTGTVQVRMALLNNAPSFRMDYSPAASGGSNSADTFAVLVGALQLRFDRSDKGLFRESADTPNSYTGQAGKFLKVNTDATALEFTDAPSGGGGGGLTQTQVDARITALRPNAFTNADETKLDGIETAATADQSATEIRDALAGLSGNARLAASAIRGLPSGGSARSFLVEANPTATVSQTTGGTANTYVAYETLMTAAAITSAQAGVVEIGVFVHADVTTVSSGGGDRVVTKARLRRARSSTTSDLKEFYHYGPRNVPNVASGEDDWYFAFKTTAQAGDVYSVQVQTASQVGSRTTEFNTTQNLMQITPIG